MKKTTVRTKAILYSGWRLWGSVLLLACMWCHSQPAVVAPAPAGAAPAAPGVEPVPPVPTREELMYQARERGQRALDIGVYTTAIKFFTEYRKLAGTSEPQFADATVYLARACLLDGKPDLASLALDRHQKDSPGLQDADYKNALAYCRAATLLGMGKPKLASEQGSALLKPGLDAEYRRMTLRLLADAYVKMDQWPEAEAALVTIVREFPKAKGLLKVRQLLVRAYVSTGKFTEAEALLKDITQLHPEAPAAEVGRQRVLVLAHMGKLDEAMVAYRSISGERPRRPEQSWWLTAFSLGGGLIGARRYDDALLVLPDAVGLAVNEEDRVQSMLTVAECQIALEKTALAIDTLETFKKEYPSRLEIVPVIIKLAELLRSTQKYMTAGDYFGQVMGNEKAAPGFRYRACVSRGWCFRDAGQFDQGIKTFAEGEGLGSTPNQKAQALTLAGDTAFHVKNYVQAAGFFGSVADRYPASDQAERGRLLEGRSRFEAKLFDQAASSYQRFLKDFPQSTEAETAELEYGIAQRHGADSAGDYAQAFDTLSGFVVHHPKSNSVPRALMEGANAAEGAEKILEAVKALGTLIGEHPDSALYPQAIYQRTRLHFYRADFENAIADGTIFLEKFPLLPLAVDVLMWLGDHYANAGEYEKSMGYFAQLKAKHPTSTLAPVALYEAAYCAYQIQRFTTASELLASLQAMTSPKPSDVTLSKAELLTGDILSRDGEYATAIQHFARARELAGNTPQGLAALGRQGEMFYSLAATDQANLKDAVSCFQAIIDTKGASRDIREVATYRLAKCYEMQGPEKRRDAIDCYMSVVIRYEMGVSKDRVRDWFYFARSGYDAARLLQLEGGESNIMRAWRVYKRIAGSGIPTAGEALKKHEELGRLHHLED
ncbi:MAG: tetratricopeptide repeat protein [Victivallales bacterium]|nr:tetratricopeptide repeat protein [Victivallales bacterium]